MIINILMPFTIMFSATQQAKIDSKFSGPYCGIYCLYTLLKSTNENTAFESFLKSKYIGSSKGSSLAELQKAAQDHGMKAVALGNLTSRELRICPYPIILHVKGDPYSKQYDHFELLLGTQNQQVRLFDPPGTIELVSLPELAARWDGAGLIVSKTPIELTAIYAPVKKQLAVYGSVALIMILISRLVCSHWSAISPIKSPRHRLEQSLLQTLGLLTGALAMGLFCHFWDDEGFLSPSSAVASVAQAYQGTFIPKLSIQAVRELLDSGAHFVDARYVEDFKAGHLKNAISVPVSASIEQRQRAMNGIARDARIAVYCQSSGCPFAERVAVALMADGFTNVVLLEGGWQKWIENKEPR